MMSSEGIKLINAFTSANNGTVSDLLKYSSVQSWINDHIDVDALEIKPITKLKWITPLCVAILFAPLSEVQDLVEAGASPLNLNNETCSALTMCCFTKKESLEKARYFLSRNKELLEKRDHQQFTCLHSAAEHGLTKLCDLLLQEGANVHARTGKKATALHLAVLEDNATTAQCILRHKADINAETYTGLTALHMACERGHLNTVIALTSYPECDTEAQDDMGNTAAGLASANNHADIVAHFQKLTKSASSSDLNQIFKVPRNLWRAVFKKGLSGRQKTQQSKVPPGKTKDETETIPYYPQRKTAVLLLVSMFRLDLTGYCRDHDDIKTFFEDVLGFTCLEYFDCTRLELFDAFEHTKQEIRRLTEERQNVTRLVVIILSHGYLDGIFACEGYVNRSPVVYFEDIINHFNILPELKDFPKIFIFQSCRITEYMYETVGSIFDVVKSASCDRGVLDKPSVSLDPIADADCLILFSTTPHRNSYVSSKGGSWLISSLLKVFRDLHENTDIEVMLKLVTLLVSEQRGATYGHEGLHDAAQVPIRQSTLRKMCLL